VRPGKSVVWGAAVAAAVVLAGPAVAATAAAPASAAQPDLLLSGSAVYRYSAGHGATKIVSEGVDAAASRDGRHIAYTVGIYSYVINSDGTGNRRVLAFPAGAGSSANAYSWSPDNQKLAVDEVFMTGNQTHHAIAILDLVKNTTKRIEVDRAYLPQWSPKGDWLAVTRLKKVGTGFAQLGLGLLRPDGSALRTLTSDSTDVGPSWSPDGAQLAFVRGSYRAAHPGHFALDAMSVATGSVRLIHALPVNKYGPSVPYWSPRGDQIAIALAVFQGDGQTRTWVLKPNGTDGHWGTPAPNAVGSVEAELSGWLAN
jgi:Tol biopolymer transport system component